MPGGSSTCVGIDGGAEEGAGTIGAAPGLAAEPDWMPPVVPPPGLKVGNGVATKLPTPPCA